MRAHVFTAHEGFLSPVVVCLDGRFVFVGDEREWELELGDEFVVRLHWVDADAQHDCTSFLEFVVGIAECARLFGAAGCIVAGIKVKHDMFALKIAESDAATAANRSREIRSLIACFECEVNGGCHTSMRISHPQSNAIPYF